MSTPSSVQSQFEHPSVSIETLGCKVNLFESEYISSQLQSLPRAKINSHGKDVCIVNTCTVTREADRQSRQAIRRVIRKNPDSTIIVTGCYAEMHADECASIQGVDYVVPGSRKLQIPQLIAGEVDIDDLASSSKNEDSTLMPELAVTGFDSRTRANLQVQQGCDNGCTFCIIHKARGPSRSIAPTTVLRQVESFVEQGFAEIVICGIDLGSYGDDLEIGSNFDMNLAELTSELAERHSDTRFRLSSIDPAHITSKLVSVIERFDNICPHIHLSLQSASPIILKRMKRRYQPDDVYAAVAALRTVRSDLVLSADIMAGFPTETESDFEMTKSAIYDLEIAYPHVFAYSERDGTPAARIPKQVPPQVRKSRARLLRHAGDAVRQKVLSSYVGKSAEVLTECRVRHTNSMLYRARLSNYLPVYFESKHDVSGRFMELKLTDLHHDGLLGQLHKS